jgi:diguanylate cyclase
LSTANTTLPPIAEVLDLLPDAVCMVDPEGRILFVSTSFERILGYAPQEVLGRKTFDLIHPDDLDATRLQAQKVMDGMQQRHFRNRYLHKLGHYVDIQWSAHWLPDYRVRIGVGREIGDLRRAERELEHRASHDPLTDLPNRRHLQHELQRAIDHALQYGSTLAVLYLDLDGFKAANDRGGHEAGDRILRDVARRLLDGVRQSDLVARVGGDEFVVLLPGCRDQAGARTVAEGLRQRLKPAFALPDGPTHLDASVGIACFPADGTTAEALLAKADARMYEAKRAKPAPSMAAAPGARVAALKQ